MFLKFKFSFVLAAIFLAINANANNFQIKDTNYYCELFQFKKKLNANSFLYTPCAIKSKGDVVYHRSYKELVIYDDKFMVVLPYYFERGSNFESPLYYKATLKQSQILEAIQEKNNYKVIMASKKYTL